MARILFFGTCAGTEPIPGMQHSSLAIEAGGLYYWFDAGENCCRTATEMGVDCFKMKAIFISHTHIDHVGGLMNLLWNVKNLKAMGRGMLPGGGISVFTPNMEGLEAMATAYYYNEGGHLFSESDFHVNRTLDGLVYEDENIKVYAVHNEHMARSKDGSYLSYSYIIEVAGKRVVYSGDVRKLSELDEGMKAGCDILICETGHHKVDDVCRYAEEREVETLLFTHNGREIINNRADAEKRLARCSCKAIICHDKMIFEI